MAGAADRIRWTTGIRARQSSSRPVGSASTFSAAGAAGRSSHPSAAPMRSAPVDLQSPGPELPGTGARKRTAGTLLSEAAAIAESTGARRIMRQVDEARAHLAAVIRKDLCTYSMIILRQEKILRDHGADGGSMRGQSGRRVFFGWCDVAKKIRRPGAASRQSDRLGCERPQQDSNLRTRLRRPMLYPLSYGGSLTQKCYQPGAALVTPARDARVRRAGHARRPVAGAVCSSRPRR